MNVVRSIQKSTFRTIVTWVLKNQFVLHPLNTRDVLKVVLGARMWLPCAGDIADAALLAKLDLWVINPQVRRQFSLHWYSTFKDDLIFVIGGTMATRNTFFSRVRELGGYFRFDPLELSTTEMVYLDLRISFGPRWHSSGLMDYAPYRKPSSKWLPLTPDSFHHPSVHRSWPDALVRSLRSHCS